MLTLQSRDTEFLLLADGKPLMGSDQHGSEDALATLTCRRLRTPTPHVLIGGLGLGFTLRAALDVLPAGARVVVAELVPAVVTWNRGPLGPLAGNPLEDRRVEGGRNRRGRGAARADRRVRCRAARRRQRLRRPDDFDQRLALRRPRHRHHPHGTDPGRGTRHVAGVPTIRNSRAACASTASPLPSSTFAAAAENAAHAIPCSSPTSQSDGNPSGTFPRCDRRC